MAVIHVLGWAWEALRPHTTLVLIFVAVILAVRYMLLPRRCPLPPGPWGVPVLGYLPFLSKDIHRNLFGIAQRFGPIFRLSFGTKNVVVLADPEVIREAFNREEFHGRPSGPLYDIFEGYGFLNVSGQLWKDQRRYLHEKLRAMGMKTLGVGREQMEGRIQREAKRLLHCLASMQGKAMDVGEALCNASTNVICGILMSITFQPDDPDFKRFMELYAEGFQLFLKCDIVTHISAFRHIPSVSATIKKLSQNRVEVNGMIGNIIKKRRENFDPSHTPEDILDHYLLEEHKAKEEGRVLYEGKDPDRQLSQIIVDMFSAGQETVKTCLMWSLVFMQHHPEVMLKVQEELDAVVGRSRMPCMDDQPHLPYTQATLWEVLRRCTPAPLGTSHATSKDTTIRGYSIPEGTTVMPLLYSCHMDPKLWVDPERFDPQRFIDAEGGVKKYREFLPFGIGRRMCLGHVLARSELFLFFTAMLHVFEVARPDGEPLPSLEGNLHTTYMPKPFKVRFIPRDVSSGIGSVNNRPYEFRTAGL